MRVLQLSVAAALPIALACSAGAASAATVIQPDEAGSKDVFVYAFEIPGTLGVPGVPAESNFDEPNVPATALAPFGQTLGVAETTPFVNPADPDFPTTVREHTTRSLVEFDLTDIATTELRSAKFSLTGIGNLAPFAAPSEAFPITVNLKPVLEDWDEGMVTWNTRPTAGDLFTSTTMTDGMQVLEFDITALVQGWLDDPSSNYGFELSQDAIVQTDMPSMLTPNDLFAVGLFASSASPDAAARPYLTVDVAPVPVPAAAFLLVGGFGLLGGLGKMRRRT